MPNPDRLVHLTAQRDDMKDVAAIHTRNYQRALGLHRNAALSDEELDRAKELLDGARFNLETAELALLDEAAKP